jgi:hypothetical protein
VSRLFRIGVNVTVLDPPPCSQGSPGIVVASALRAACPCCESVLVLPLRTSELHGAGSCSRCVVLPGVRRPPARADASHQKSGSDRVRRQGALCRHRLAGHTDNEGRPPGWGGVCARKAGRLGPASHHVLAPTAGGRSTRVSPSPDTARVGACSRHGSRGESLRH